MPIRSTHPNNPSDHKHRHHRTRPLALALDGEPVKKIIKYTGLTAEEIDKL